MGSIYNFERKRREVLIWSLSGVKCFGVHVIQPKIIIWYFRDCQNSHLKPYTLPLFIFCIFSCCFWPETKSSWSVLLLEAYQPFLDLMFCTACWIFSTPFTSCSPNSPPIQQQQNKNLFFLTGCCCTFTPLSQLSHKLDFNSRKKTVEIKGK